MVGEVTHPQLINFVLPQDAAPTITPSPEAGDARALGSPYSARHARAAGGVPGSRAPLPIRSVERRRWSADLTGSAVTGLIVHGVGGIGKSALAAGIAERVGRFEPGWLAVVISGEVSADAFLADVATAIGRHPAAGALSGSGAEAVQAAARIELPWAHRLALLREHVLGQLPVLVVLDNFDDNLSAASGSRTVRDPALAALLADWAGPPRLGRLLITCRHGFGLPGAGRQAFGLRHLGPLSRSEAAELAMSLPALGLLGEQELDRAWRLVAGHPRAMQYLNALLSAGHAGFPDVAGRITGAIRARTGQPVPPAGPDAPTRLSAADAETIALAASDLLLGDLCDLLSADAEALLIGASVYRAPIGSNVALRPAGQYRAAAELACLVAECAATGLLAADPKGEPAEVFVHRWTASELHRRLAEAQRGGEVASAHRRAADYWRWRAAARPQDRHAQLEASYHLLRADRLARQDQQDQPAAGRPPAAIRRLPLPGAVSVAAAVLAFLAAGAAGAAGIIAAHHPGSSVALARAARSASHAAAARDQAAAWVALQVGRDAIIGCDPVMCAALQAHGIPAGNLLALRPGSSPVSSDVLMATAAVRSQFGGRLASGYAPEVIASFGSGGQRVDVRAIAPDGAAAYRAALAADLAARRQAGRQLLRDPRVSVQAAARSELVTGRVDSRLLMMLATLAAAGPLQITSFGDSGPGSSAGLPLRAAELAVSGHGTALQHMLAYVRAQRPPYLPAQAAIVRAAAGTPVLSIQFAAPSPIGLLGTQQAS